jgi:hypothetical protein
LENRFPLATAAHYHARRRSMWAACSTPCTTLRGELGFVGLITLVPLAAV